MQKIILVTVFMTLLLGAHAQYIMDGHHMVYKGVSFGESLPTFRQKLKVRNLEFNHDDPNDRAYLLGEYTNGPLRGNIATISYDEVNDRVTKITVSEFYRLSNEAKPKFKQLLANIKRAYPNALFECVAAKNEWGSRMERYCWNILSADKEYMLGSVYVTLDMNDDDPHYSASITISDAYNCMLADDIEYGLDDISSIMYPKYDACYTFLDEDNLVIYPVKNKKIGMVLATSDDRKKILDLLYNTDCSDAEKRRQIGNYLDQLPLFNQEYLCMTEGCFNSKDTYWGIRQDPNARVVEDYPPQPNLDYNYRQSAQKPQSKTPAKQDAGKAFREWLFDGIMGKELVDFYKSNGTYDSMVGIMGGLINVMGETGGTTNWDLLSPEQKAVIHEHDNGR